MKLDGKNFVLVEDRYLLWFVGEIEKITDGNDYPLPRLPKLRKP